MNSTRGIAKDGPRPDSLATLAFLAKLVRFMKHRTLLLYNLDSAAYPSFSLVQWQAVMVIAAFSKLMVQKP